MAECVKPSANPLQGIWATWESITEKINGTFEVSFGI